MITRFEYVGRCMSLLAIWQAVPDSSAPGEYSLPPLSFKFGSIKISEYPNSDVCGGIRLGFNLCLLVLSGFDASKLLNRDGVADNDGCWLKAVTTYRPIKIYVSRAL